MGHMYEHALQTWMLGDMPVSEMFDCLQSIDFSADLCIHESGYTAPERLLAEPKTVWAGRKISSCTAMFTGKHLNLSDRDPAVRQHAIEFAKRCVDATAYVGASKMLVSPSYISDGASYSQSREADWCVGTQSLREIAKYAEKYNINLMIEPINRYRVSLVHTVAEGLQMADDTQMANVGVVPDVFHMCMEETAGVQAALKQADKRMLCLHLGGNTRCVPGQDSFDWVETMKTLALLGYTGALSYEPVKLYFDKKSVQTDRTYRESFLAELKGAREYLDEISEWL